MRSHSEPLLSVGTVSRRQVVPSAEVQIAGARSTRPPATKPPLPGIPAIATAREVGVVSIVVSAQCSASVEVQPIAVQTPRSAT